MRLVEKEDQLGLVRIADFGKLLVQLRQQPQQKRRVDARRTHQLIGSENVDHAPAVGVGLHEVVNVQRRLAEKFAAAFLSERDQPALNRPNTGGRDVAVLRLQRLCLLANILQHGLQILEVEQQQLMVVGYLEHQRQNSRLRIVEVEQSAEQQWPHLGDSGANGMSLLAEYVPERNGTSYELEALELHLLHALGDLGIVLACLAD